MAQRNSANINYAKQSEADKASFLQYVATAKPTTALSMDGWQYAEQIYQTAKAAGYEIMSIYRRFFPGGGGVDEGNVYNLWTPTQYADYITENGAVSKNLWIYVLNEPVEYTTEGWKMLSRWLVQITQLLISRGYRVVIGNIGSAVIEPYHVSEGGLDELLRAVSQWSNNTIGGVWKPLAVLALHEYTGIILPFGVGYIRTDQLTDKNNVQPEQWPTDLPIAYVSEHVVAGRPTRFPKYWHLKRYSWLLLRCDELGVVRFYFVVTEYGLDRMPDMTATTPTQPVNVYDVLQSRYGAGGHRIIRGHDSCSGVFQYYYGHRGWDFEKSLFEQAKWADTYVYDDHCIGMMWFTRSRAPDWKDEYGFDLSDRPAFWSLLAASPSPIIAKGSTVAITTLQNPLPSDSPLWRVGRVRSLNTANKINIRYAPTSVDNTPFTVLDGVWKEDASLADRPTTDIPTWWPEGWAQIKFGTVHGWISRALINFQEDDGFWLLHPADFAYTVTGLMNDSRTYGRHEGMDFAPQAGVENPRVRAAHAGVVESKGYNAEGYGYYVRIKHDWTTPNGEAVVYRTWYGHLKEPSALTVGQQVVVGQTIGIAGSSGNSTGVHLHLTVARVPDGLSGYVVDSVVDPSYYLVNSLPIDEIEDPIENLLLKVKAQVVILEELRVILVNNRTALNDLRTRINEAITQSDEVMADAKSLIDVLESF